MQKETSRSLFYPSLHTGASSNIDIFLKNQKHSNQGIKSHEVNLKSKIGANLVLDVLKNVRKEYICYLWKSYVFQIEQVIASISNEM